MGFDVMNSLFFNSSLSSTVLLFRHLVCEQPLVDLRNCTRDSQLSACNLLFPSSSELYPFQQSEIHFHRSKFFHKFTIFSVTVLTSSIWDLEEKSIYPVYASQKSTVVGLPCPCCFFDVWTNFRQSQQFQGHHPFVQTFLSDTLLWCNYSNPFYRTFTSI